jgi:propionyl-CoA synthetase
MCRHRCSRPAEGPGSSRQMVCDRIGPVAAFKTAIVVKLLPKTRSGKVLRGIMQKIADCQEYRMPATIDDPTLLQEIEESLKNP